MPNPFRVGPIQVPANWGQASGDDDQPTQISAGDVDIIIDTGDPEDEQEDHGDPEFGDNLVDRIDPHELMQLAGDLIQSIEGDDGGRAEWLQDFAEGENLLGLKLETPQASLGTSSQTAEGMSRVYDTLLLEAILRFQANARGELLPSRGPVKVDNQGEDDIAGGDELASKLEKALNYYFTVGAPEYYPDTDRMFFMQGFCGSGFKKIYFCPMRRRPVSESVGAKDLILTPGSTDLRNCPRKTHVIDMDPQTLKRLKILGVYRDVEVGNQSSPQSNPATLQEEQITGVKRANLKPEDTHHIIWECYTTLDLPGFEDKDENGKETGLPLPYKVTLHKDSKETLEIRRNWKEDDADKKERRVFVKYPFVEAMSIYGIGLLHILGNTTRAITAAKRIALDNGMFANFPGFIYDKLAGRQLTNEFRVPPGGGIPIDGLGNAVKDLFAELPYRDVSPNFLQIIEQLSTQGQRVGGTAELPVGEGRQDAPVGTTLALLEQATKVVDAVHKRMHAAQAEEFQLMKELFLKDPEALWRHSLEETESWDKPSIMAALKRCDIVPQADPNTPSQMHRLMKGQAVVQLANGAPDIIDKKKAYTYALEMLGVGDPQDLFIPPPPPGTQPQPDPATMAKVAGVQATAQLGQQKIALGAAQLQQKEQSEQRQHQIDLARVNQEASDAVGRDQNDLVRAQMDNQTKIATNSADNQTAMDISAAEIAAGHKSDLRDGNGLNPQ